ncbi:MAG: hypothetical protein KAR06_04460 [Deltaproteobacteria bacterium]|nr:hypothetical protein [Deltaproteobacteria bacterium]
MKREMSNQAKVAKLCRQYCKSIGVKARANSDSYSMGDSVRVKVEDQPPSIKKQLEDEFSQYQYGSFNGMEDIYEYSNSRKDIPQTKYLFIENDISDDLRHAAWLFLRKKYPANGESLPVNYDDAKRLQWSCDEWNHDDLVEMQVRKILIGSDFGLNKENSVEFWDSIVTPKEATPKKAEPFTASGVTVREGTKPGYSEVIFPSKPSKAVIDSLKEGGFRWSRFNGLWYGKTANLPDSLSDGEPEQSSAEPIPAQRETTLGRGDKFRKLAEGLQGKIDSCFSDRLENTPKRAAQGASARLEGHKLERTQKALIALAEMHDSGEVVSLLAGLSSKKDVYELMGEKTEQVPNGYHAYSIGTGEPRVETPVSLALWALLGGKSPEEKKAEEVAQKVRELKFSNIPGYFPTPDKLIDKMLEYVCIDDDSKILEPELGSCAIADRIKSAHPQAVVKGYETHHSLAEIGELKGYLIEQADFLTVEPSPEYDLVIMNPPFEKLQDCAHVMHAFKFLKPGGRLVSIMSPSWKFNSNKKAEAFRNFFDLHGVQSEEVEAGEFKESGTNISTTIVIIERSL